LSVTRSSLLSRACSNDDPRRRLESSIFRVLDVFKSQNVEFVEEVNQVRRYRNWVAHGRRVTALPFVDPEMAYERSKRFLDRFTEPVANDE
jgi:hypothetical protein